MESIRFHFENASWAFDHSEYENLRTLAKEKLDLLKSKKGKGNDFLGWLELPGQISPEFLTEISETAESLANSSEICLVIGIGGSYLGAKAVIEALSDSFSTLKNKNKTHVVFGGQNICEDYTSQLIDLLEKKSFSIIVISKSGTTTEPAIAFRIFRDLLINKVGKEEAKKRIVAVTDKDRGALKTLCDKEGYKTFVIPDDVGGRFSVLTPVGLLPLAVAGLNISEFVNGSREMMNATLFNNDLNAINYAAIRNVLYNHGLAIEMLVNYRPALSYISEWWKQLFGESEGKEHKGIFPASANFTTDLHSLGQYMQDGVRTIFETVLSVSRTKSTISIPFDQTDTDGLNYIAGKRLSEVNLCAEKGTTQAHMDGKVPVLNISIPELNEYYIGQLLYFFEISCAISGYILDVNPFDQPGVEAYKKNMFALLGKNS